jgi:hypothetical protein
MNNLHRATRGASLQHTGLFKSMSLGGKWNLYYYKGALNGVAIFEVTEPGCPSYPPILMDVHCMTGATLMTKLTHVWEEAERFQSEGVTA